MGKIELKSYLQRQFQSSFIDGTVTGTVEYNGMGKWYDYYDTDQIDFFNWQTTPTIQPNEPGRSCTKMFFYGLDDVKNGLGDCPCRAVTGDECYYKVSKFWFDWEKL